jgi:hypothetical protein
MWRTYLPKAEIVGVDLFEKDLPSEKRLTVLRGDQSNRQFLATLVSGHGPFDVVIDDGSHRGEHINVTFTALWPGVRSRGWYVIEDLETAFDPAYGGGAPGLAGTSLDLLKGLLDGVQGQTALEVRAVHVHPNIAFIEKP